MLCDATQSLCNAVFPLRLLTVGGPVRGWDLEDDVTIYGTHLRPGRVPMFSLTKAFGKGCLAAGTSCAVLC